MKWKHCTALLGLLVCLLSACAWLPQPPGEPDASADGERPPFLFSADEEDPANSAAHLPGDGFAPLAVPDGPFDGAVRDWTFGGAADGQNRPLICLKAQEEYGLFGAAAFGPDETAVYLTFDFGYETGYSTQILNTLQEKDAKATFFITGHFLDSAGGAVERMIADGHSVGGHSATHPAAPGGVAGLPQARREDEIGAIAARLADEYGYETRLFRFPEGIYSEAALADAAALGQYSVFWSYAYADWDEEDQPPVISSLEKALDAACPGAIYLLHPQKTNAAILGGLIDGLRGMGYRVEAL